MIRGSITILLLFFSILAIGQVSIAATAANDTILANDRLEVSYKINLPAGVTLTSIDFEPLMAMKNLAYPQDTINFDELFEINGIDGGIFKISENNLKIDVESYGGPLPIEGMIKMSILNVGAGRLPKPLIKTDPNIQELPLESSIFFVLPRSNASAQDSLNILAVKDYIKEERNWTDVLDIAKYILGLGLFIYAIYYFIKRQQRIDSEREEAPEIIIKAPAHEIAIKALDELSNKQLWETGKVKEYHSELTRIMRQYLEDRYDIQALEMTTSQISSHTQKYLDTPSNKSLIDILQIADIIKFAKGEAGKEINERFLNESYAIIHKTKKLNLTEEERQDGITK